MRDQFTLPKINLSTKNSNNFTGTLHNKGLINDKKNYYEFTTESGELVNLKKISYKIHDKAYNGGDPKEDIDVWSAYVTLVVHCKETDAQYKSTYLIISPTKGFRDYDFYNDYAEFTIINQ